jgi:hypothetical protein
LVCSRRSYVIYLLFSSESLSIIVLNLKTKKLLYTRDG